MDRIKKVVLDRIRTLFREAEKRRDMADRYVEIAVRLARSTRTRIPRELRTRYCKKCMRYWIPGKTVEVRVKRRGGKKFVIYRCLHCGYEKLFFVP